MNMNVNLNKNGGSSEDTPIPTPSPVTNNNSDSSVDTIKKNFSIIKNSVDNIGSEIKTKADNVSDDLLNIAKNPTDSIETLIQMLIHIPSVIGQIIEDPEFIVQVKIISLTLAKALSESIEIITPEVSEAIAKMVGNVGRYSSLALIDAIGVIPGVGIAVDIILTAHNVLKVIFSFTNVGLEMSEVYYTLISNMIRVYKKNVKEVKAAHGRIKNSLNQFNNTNTQIQSGGKKIHLNEMNVINKKQQIKKQKSKTYSKTKKYKKRM